MITSDILQSVGYSMERAYKKTRSQGEAVEKVRDEFPDIDLNILWAMWYAIDAYVDINVNPNE